VSIEHIKSFIAQDMDIVDDVIRDKLHSHVALIRQVSEYIINSGGKRLRPALVILSAGASGYSGKHQYNLAAVVEFIHTATLLHDDVVDESNLRRNKETANALFGNAASVLVGDFLYSRAFQMMVEVDNMRVMQVLADATNTIAEGEVLQLLNCRDPNVEEDNYLRVIRFKTAKLFEAASRLGAILGNATPDEEEALSVYGMHLGTAFQLIDDMLDYTGDDQDTGKNLGDDLAEGKPTLPLIYAMRSGTPEQANIIRNAIEKGGADGFQPVLDVIQQTAALDYAKKCAHAEVDTATAAIASLPESEYKECLLQLASFAVTRNY
jgi:octaprenyl-diphosphate synthase